MKLARNLSSLWLAILCPVLVGGMAGCSTQQFYANYYLDPKPPKLSVADLKRPASPQPVYLVFDMYAGGTAFREATQKLGPRVARIVEDSGLFSSLTQTRNLPEGLTSGLAGSKGAIVYQFTATYQAPGQEAVKKVFPHAVHIVEGDSPQLADSFPMTASHAMDAMVDQAMLRFLRDLQREGKL